MPIPAFSEAEVRQILRLSEKTEPAGGGSAGHSGERHVSLSNEALNDRMLWGGGTVHGIRMYTAFLTFDDQVRTATEVLNSAQARPLLEAFYADRRRVQCDLKDIVLKNSVRIRMAVAGGVHTYPNASFATMIVRRDVTRPRQLHVITTFARLAVAGVDP